MPLLDQIANLSGNIQQDRLRQEQAQMQQAEFQQLTAQRQQMMQLRELQMQSAQADLLKQRKQAELIEGFDSKTHDPKEYYKSDPDLLSSVLETEKQIADLDAGQRKKFTEYNDTVGKEAHAILQLPKAKRWPAFQKTLERLKEVYPNLSEQDLSQVNPGNLSDFLKQTKARSKFGQDIYKIQLEGEQRLKQAEAKAAAKAKAGGKVPVPRKAGTKAVEDATAVLKGRDTFDTAGFDFSGKEYKRMGTAVAERAYELQSQAKGMNLTLDETTARELAADELEQTIQTEDSFWVGRDIKGPIKFPSGTSQVLLDHVGLSDAGADTAAGTLKQDPRVAAFMKANNISDPDEALKILREAGKI